MFSRFILHLDDSSIAEDSGKWDAWVISLKFRKGLFVLRRAACTIAAATKRGVDADMLMKTGQKA
jgi:hypothetical protein